MDHTIFELDNQVESIHILLVMDVTIQEGVAHTTETIQVETVAAIQREVAVVQVGTVAAIQQEVAVVPKKVGELREPKTLEKTPKTNLS